MIIGLTRKLTVRMGEYESMIITGHASIDTNADADLLEDRQVDPYDLLQINAFLRKTIDELVKSDVYEAHMTTAMSESFIHDYQEALEERAQA